MKKIITICLLALVSCGGGGTGNSNSTTKYLASNIIFSSAEAAQARIRGAVVDTDTQILASQVILDTATLGITSDNVQAAFQETNPDLSQLIIGTWLVKEIPAGGAYETDAPYYIDALTFKFNEDGTVDMTCIDDSASGISNLCEMVSVYLNTSLRYSVIENSIVSIKFIGENPSDHNVRASFYPSIINSVTSDKISMSYNGAISIWTKQ